MAVHGRFAVNETEACLQCGREGLGLIPPLAFEAASCLWSDQSKEELIDARCAPALALIIYSCGCYVSAEVQAFLDGIIEISAPILSE